MTGREKASFGSALLGGWSRWCRLVEWGWALAGSVVARCGGGPAVRLSPAARDRVIHLIEGDLDCLIEDATERSITERSAEELLLNRELLAWLRGGPLPGQGAVELLEENVEVFYRAPGEEERKRGQALRDALDVLGRALAEATAAGRLGEADLGVEASAERDLRRWGQRLDELRKGKNMTIGELAERSEIEVVGIVGFIYGAEEPGAVEMMSLAAALETEPRELFPEFLEGAEDEEDHEAPGDPADDGRGDA